MNFSEAELKVLELLAKYKFLTSSQFVKLGVRNDRDNITKILRELLHTKKNLIERSSFGFMAGYGRLEDFYFLTKKGVNFLVEELGKDPSNIKAPIGTTTLFQRDYFHRWWCIDFYILLSQWIQTQEGEIIFLNYYFDKVGSNRNQDKGASKSINSLELTDEHTTKKSYIIPDIITKFKTPQREYLYIYEQHNGKDTKRAIEQIEQHFIALAQGTTNKKYNYEKATRIIFVFEFESCKKATIQRLKEIEHSQNFNNLFLFKTNEELKQDFFSKWELIDGTKTNFI